MGLRRRLWGADGLGVSLTLGVLLMVGAPLGCSSGSGVGGGADVSVDAQVGDAASSDVPTGAADAQAEPTDDAGASGGQDGAGAVGAADDAGTTDPDPTDVAGDPTTDASAQQDVPGDGEPCDGCFGAPCSENVDCNSGWCQPGPDGLVCTKTCDSACPAGWSCKSVNPAGGDATFLCVYLHAPYCKPCHDDDDCGDLAVADGSNRCVARADGAGSFCVTNCTDGGQCPGGSECGPLAVESSDQEYCQPIDGALCACSAASVEAELTTPCFAANEVGTCTGLRVCGQEGLTTCDAETATDDICNGLDDDCDGATDEDYPDKGAACDGDDPDECADGIWECVGGALECSDDAATGEEVCDLIDNDCDGLTDAEDEGMVRPACANDEGACSGLLAPASLCIDGTWDTCEAADYQAASATFEADSELSCDGIDNDCDGATDEDFTMTQLDATVLTGVGVGCGSGPCSGGTTVCAEDGTGLVCPGEAAAMDEVCDGDDNDCDGLIDTADDDLESPPCEVQEGVCEGSKKPDTLCVAGGWKACTAVVYTTHSDAWQDGVETACDGVDNDCDGGTDEDFTVTLLDGSTLDAVGLECGSGACAGGLTQCTADHTGLECSTETAAGEVCDGVDNDCDGLTDGDDPGLVRPPCELTDGACADVAKPAALCVAGAWKPCTAETYLAVAATYQEGAETACDGTDNDCDGATDEDFSIVQADGIPVSGIDAPCGLGECAGTTTVCNLAGDGIACPGQSNLATETCDGADNDCDGITDFPDPDLVLADCALSAGVCAGAKVSAAQCVGGSWGGCTVTQYLINNPAYQADTEVLCDGLDNDCDGGTDEDFSVTLLDASTVSGIDAGCGTGACANGLTVCAPGGVAITCPTEGNTSAEVCDGVDNDCDGLTDADDPDLQLAACGKQLGVCSGSTHVAADCSGGAWQPCSNSLYAAHAGTYQAGSESDCDTLDNDCDGGTDEDFSLTLLNNITVTGTGSGCGVGACSGGVTACNGAGNGITCPSESNASQEVCGGGDDDCDGLTDSLDPSMSAGGACEKQTGVCSGATKPTNLCLGGTWAACDDAAYIAHNGNYEAVEDTCDNLDNDCNGSKDPDGSAGCVPQWLDSDSDDYGNASVSACRCGGVISGWTDNDDDCNDNETDGHPNASAWHTSTMNNGSWDWNCNNQTDQHWTAAAGSCVLAVDLGNVCQPSGTTPGWQGSAKSCGSSGTWVSFGDCSINIPCCGTLFGTCVLPCLPECSWDGGTGRTQECR